MGTKRCENTFVTIIVTAVSRVYLLICSWNIYHSKCAVCVTLRCQQVPALSLRYFGLLLLDRQQPLWQWPERIIVTEPETMGRKGAVKQSALIRHKGDKRRRKVSPSDRQARSTFNWNYRPADKSISLISGLGNWTDLQDKSQCKHKSKSTVLMLDEFYCLVIGLLLRFFEWLMIFCLSSPQSFEINLIIGCRKPLPLNSHRPNPGSYLNPRIPPVSNFQTSV